MISILLGRLGQTKTSALTAFAFDAYERGIDVMANYTLMFPKVRASGALLPLDAKMLLDERHEIENLFLALDEIWKLADARRSSSKRNLSLSRLFIQSRKDDMSIAGTVPYFGYVDPRLRDVSDLLGLCSKLDRNLRPILAPLEWDPEGYSQVQFHYPSLVPVGLPLRFRLGPLSKMFHTREKPRGFEDEP